MNEGLVPGDVIVAEGVGLLREGTPIVPKGQQAAQPQQQQPQESQAQQPEARQETPAQESKAQDAAKAEAIRRHTDKE